MIHLNFRKFIDYRNNLNDYFRNIINDNVIKYYVLEIQIDLNFERFNYKNNDFKNNIFKHEIFNLVYFNHKNNDFKNCILEHRIFKYKLLC